ncbi:hypothetical protein DXG01_008155, partial [Tephrocybe rancida]
MQALQHICICCEQEYTTASGLNYHARTCKATRKRVGSALHNLRDVWRAKRRRLNPVGSDPVPHEGHSLLSQVEQMVVTMDETAAASTEGASTVAETRTPGTDPPKQVGQDPDLQPIVDVNPGRRARPPRIPKLPMRFRDFIPQSTFPLSIPQTVQSLPAIPELAVESEVPNLEPVGPSLHAAPNATLPRAFTSPRNVFGLSRTYHGTQVPSHDPEESITLKSLDDTPMPNDRLEGLALASSPSPYFPYPNKNSFALGKWFWDPGMQKSQRSFKKLINIVSSDDFAPKDIQNTRWGAIDRILGQNDFDDGSDQHEWEDEDAGWKKTPITLDIPFHKRMKTKRAQQHLAGSIYHRSIVAVIKEKLANVQDNKGFHYEPYELSWTPKPGSESQRVYGESYTSPAFISAHRQLQESPPEPGCNLPRCVVGLMIWSDATHLTNFGSSKLWPSYVFFSNESKYDRCKPSLNLANHIAYFESLPDSFKDFASEHVGGKGPNKVFLAHCNREMYHAQWKIILDDEFLDAYEHGIVIKCLDGLLRRFYPRILTYSADYPEKVLLASIRNRGSRPCPRCRILKVDLKNMGMARDMLARRRLARIDDASRRSKVDRARHFIYEKNFGVNSKVVEGLLKDDSFVPVSMLVVDILHDWEI